jgi:dynein light intermediate chain
MTIQAYQTLFESSIAFGMRKSLQAEQRTAEMHIKIEKLDEENSKLEVEIDMLSNEIMTMLDKEQEAIAEGEAIQQSKKDEFINSNKDKLQEMEAALRNLEFESRMV